MLRLALAIAVAAVLVASASAACSDQTMKAGALDYVLTLRADSPSISVATDTITINIDSVGANGRQMDSATIGLEGGTATTGYSCHDFDEGPGTQFDDRMTLTVSFPDFVAASTSPGGDVDPDNFATPGSWDESGSGAFSTDAHQTWVRTVELKFDETVEITRNGGMIEVTRAITEEFLFFVSAPTQITFKDADLIEIFATPIFNILLTGFEVDFGNFDTSTTVTGGVTNTITDPSTDAIDTTYTVTMTTIIQQPFQITSFGVNNVDDSGINTGSMLMETQTAATSITISDTTTAGGVTYNKQAWTFTFALDTCGANDGVDFTVVVGCNDAQLTAASDTCPIANDGTNDGTMTNMWDDTDAGSFTMQFADFCSFEGAYAKPFTVSVKTWDASITDGCAAETPTDTDDFVDEDTVCFRGSVTTSTPDITVDTLTCDSVAVGTTPTGTGKGPATLTSAGASTGFSGAADTCQYTVGQGTGNTDTSTEYDFNIQFTVTYVTTAARLRSKRRSLLTTETTTASTTLQISANSNQAAGVGVGVGGVTGTSSGSSLGVVVGAIMGAAVLITLAVFVGVVIVLRKSPSDDRSRSNARYNAGGAPEVTPIVIQLNGGNNGAKKTKAASSRPMARVVPDSSAEADNMTSSTAAYSSAESSSAADYSSTAASTDYVSSSYV